jgi:hypothetical protein
VDMCLDEYPTREAPFANLRRKRLANNPIGDGTEA